MSLQFSDALANFLLNFGSLAEALNDGKIEIYTGGQPANANAAKTGTLIAVITDASGAWTAETPSAGSATLAGASGSVDGMTVNGVQILDHSVPFNTTLTQTAADVAEAINLNPANKQFIATSSGAKVIITAKPGYGTVPNTWALVTSLTTMTSTDVNMGSEVAGVASANGLKLGDVVNQVLGKHPTQVWSGLGINGGGVAGWFRFYAAKADAGGLDSSQVYMRLDGNIATSGAVMNMTNTTIANGAVQTINSVALTQPES